MASVRSHLNDSMSAGNMGASESGPKPWLKVTIAVEVMQAVFHHGDQFNGSCGSSEGWGTRTSRCEPLTKWWLPVSAMTSVPGRISTWSSFSSWRSS